CPACFCPCLTYASNVQRLHALNSTGQPARDPGGANGDCALYAGLTVLGCWGWVLGRGVRRGVRERYTIPGSAASDCLATSLLAPCSLTQESLELQMEERRLL
ncbi:hypothetical protein CALCODRAFT_405813, partial [Calocera cornea HHB12733]